MAVSPPPDRAALLASLRADAEYFQPRLFALYGLHGGSGAPFLGWGVDFPSNGGAVFVDPHEDGIHHSASAERLLATYQRLGEAYLLWLD